MLSTNTKRGDVIRHTDGDVLVITKVESNVYMMSRLNKELSVIRPIGHITAFKTNPRLFNTKLTYKL